MLLTICGSIQLFLFVSDFREFTKDPDIILNAMVGNAMRIIERIHHGKKPAHSCLTSSANFPGIGQIPYIAILAVPQRHEWNSWNDIRVMNTAVNGNFKQPIRELVIPHSRTSIIKTGGQLILVFQENGSQQSQSPSQTVSRDIYGN